ncbi:MAG: hypothetical protein AAF490_30650 [Chloroflexota bacterium]
MIKNWIHKHNIHHKIRVLILFCALGGYGLSLALWWTFMNLRPFAEPSIFLSLIILHPYTSSFVLMSVSRFFPRLPTLVLIILLIIPFAMLGFGVFNAYTGL